MATKKTTTKEVVAAPVIISVLKNARITEKAAAATTHNTYVFNVQASATKSEIAKAFQAKFKQKPISVNTVQMPRKTFFRRGRLGFGTNSKKAYISVPKGVTIDIA